MYTEKARIGLVPLGSGVLAEDDLDASAAVHGEFVNAGPHNIVITAIMALVTEIIANDTAAAVVTFKKRPTPGSATAESTIDTITFPDGTAVGKVLYARPATPVSIAPGESLCIDHTTQGTDGSSSSGKCIYDWEAEFDKEQAANQTDMVASA